MSRSGSPIPQPPDHDPLLLALGEAIARLAAEYQALDEADPAEARRVVMDHLDARIDSLVAACAALPASGLEGALVQGLALASLVSGLTELEGEPTREQRDRLNRLLHSLMGALERATGMTRARFGGDFLMGRQNPFAGPRAPVAGSD